MLSKRKRSSYGIGANPHPAWPLPHQECKPTEMASLFPKGNPGEKFPCMRILRRAEISNRAKAGKPGFGGRREGAPANLCLVFCPIPADAEGLWLEPAGLCSVVTHSSLCSASQEQSGLCSS